MEQRWSQTLTETLNARGHCTTTTRLSKVDADKVRHTITISIIDKPPWWNATVNTSNVTYGQNRWLWWGQGQRRSHVCRKKTQEVSSPAQRANKADVIFARFSQRFYFRNRVKWRYICRLTFLEARMSNHDRPWKQTGLTQLRLTSCDSPHHGSLTNTIDHVDHFCP